MYSAIMESLFRECDFCKMQGVLDKSIVNKDGWYFCRHCLQEVENEMERRKQRNLFTDN